MGQRKTRNIAASDADVVALCDVSCMTHINGLLSRQGQRARAVHIAQVLANEVDVQPRRRSRRQKRSRTPPRRWQDG
jgi:L-lactate dehydrogenase complex protein LldE